MLMLFAKLLYDVWVSRGTVAGFLDRSGILERDNWAKRAIVAWELLARRAVINTEDITYVAEGWSHSVVHLTASEEAIIAVITRVYDAS